jgi:hypothetical protein
MMALQDQLTTFADLQSRLAELDPPRTGMARVYRGQTTDFGRMLPSGLRGQPLRSEAIFNAYTGVLANHLSSVVPGASSDPGAMANVLLWTRSIAQHYGPGSDFLDVTKSIQVALWFAMHRIVAASTHHVFGPLGPVNAATDTFADAETQVIQVSDSGCLFVFDVPQIAKHSLLEHGTLIDLSNAPHIFASSTRIRAQQACLIYADAELDDPDLCHFYACPPIPVGRPLADCPEICARFSVLFPGPQDDNWYDRLLSVPWTSRLFPETSRVAVAPAIPVNLFVQAAIDAVDQPLVDRLIVVPPHNVRDSVLQGIDWCADPPHPLQKTHPLEKATRVLLEAPVLSTTPAVDTGLWNEGLLVEGPWSTGVENDDGTGTELDLHNIFIEFSPLERVGWESVEHGGPMELLRGVWLIRDQGLFVISLFTQDLPKRGMTGIGAFEARFKPSANRIEFHNLDRDNASLQTFLVKRLFSSLFLLHGLTPGPHTNPFPSFWGVQPNVAAPCLVSWFKDAEVTLVRGVSEYDGQEVYVPRMTKTGDAYFTPFSMDGSVSLVCKPAEFWDINPRCLRHPQPTRE